MPMRLTAPMRVHSVRRQIHNLTVTNTPLRNDVVSEFLDIRAASFEDSNLHAAFVIEMHVQGRLRQIVTVVKIAR